MIFKQKYYIGFTAFSDAGMTVQEHPVDKSKVPGDVPDRPAYFDQEKDSMHFSFGAGLRLALDKNFVVAIDYGFAPDKRNGKGGFYLSIGNVF